jgi:hypothetical protein
MKIKSEQEEAIGKIKRLRISTNKFKIIGLVLCIISIFLNQFFLHSLLENFKYNDVLDRITIWF